MISTAASRSSTAMDQREQVVLFASSSAPCWTSTWTSCATKRATTTAIPAGRGCIRRFGCLLLHVGTDDDALWTQTVSGARRHRGMNCDSTRFVRARRHDAALVRACADDDGPAAEVGIVTLLDGRVESVHIYVEDGAGQFSRIHAAQV